ncbi:hypothetical protein KOAAANKH_00811 [Brevundimonas sp. NIBR10]|uniref:MFS transporter n=1 Tax=Brevundimonas sp. NIBR10 TaxID=3015997 RepID=UPI0022F16DAA|nr:MFS transporter [Brevundimonas sp. NIBR10]WGM45946.1 hypothetical protein KOAAANKH_00811 [Brevundimonas sp. NIBR10]
MTPLPDAASASDPHDRSGGGGLRQWWLVGCLTVFAMLAMVDKNIITLLVLPIKRDLGLSDTQIGLIIGTAFAVSNLVIGIPAGWLADKVNRKSILFVGVGLWSAMAATCGLAGNFLTLFWARAGVGLAEGLLPPAAYSLLRDGVSPARRGRAFSIYAMATLLGTGLAFVAGGLLIRALSTADFSGWPVLSGLAPWSLALIFAGLAGLPLLLLLATIREPGRGSAEQSAVSFKSALGLMWADRAVYLPLAVFSVAHAMLTQSLGVWVPALVGLRFDLGPAQMGPILGLLLMTMGPLGLVLTGFGIDRINKAGGAGSAAVAVIASVLLLAVTPFHPLVPSVETFWVAQGLVLLGATTYLAVTSTLVAQIAPQRAIGKTMAVFLVLQGALGSGVAPALTASVGEHLFAGQATPIASAMSVVHAGLALVALGSAVVLFLNFRRRLRASA